MRAINPVSEKDFNKACAEVAAFVIAMAKECTARGWTFYATKDAPESYKALKKAAAESFNGKQLPIADYGSETSIYGSSEINTLFRFYHDVVHLENDYSFSKDGESKTAYVHIRDGVRFGLSPLALRVLEADTRGQVDYYFRWRKFVNNQRAFVLSCISHGIVNAIKVEH